MDLRAGDGKPCLPSTDSFQVDSAEEYYRLHLEGYHGTAGEGSGWGRAGEPGEERRGPHCSLHALPGDSMRLPHVGSVFSCPGPRPQQLAYLLCRLLPRAWWHRNCHYANLNGLYGSTVDHQVRSGAALLRVLGAPPASVSVTHSVIGY